MNKIGWKVVAPGKNGGFRSAITTHGDLKWVRPYAVGQRTVGCEGTPLLAYRTRRAARAFFSGSGYYRVFKARLENPRPQKRIAPPFCVSAYKKFWTGSLNYEVDAPTGTLACDAITLLELA